MILIKKKEDSVFLKYIKIILVVFLIFLGLVIFYTQSYKNILVQKNNNLVYNKSNFENDFFNHSSKEISNKKLYSGNFHIQFSVDKNDSIMVFANDKLIYKLQNSPYSKTFQKQIYDIILEGENEFTIKYENFDINTPIVLVFIKDNVETIKYWEINNKTGSDQFVLTFSYDK